jgi:tRNA/rRNA methyltransferase/tRNA (cytidine32/uridine32-2'-O)-methyltransferase
MGTSPLNNVVVVLNEPQNLVNIAGVVRAMMNMGLGQLRIVNPAEFDAWRIGGIAHRSQDVVERAELFEDLTEALADATFVVGTTARARTAQRNYVRPRDVAPKIVEHARTGPVALLFGREDRGLGNDALDLCHAAAVIPTDPQYSSLNLAQAVLLLSYEIFLAAEGNTDPLPRGRRSTRPATAEELENTYAALEEGLHRIEFYKSREPAAILRTLRTVISRAEPDLQEAGLLRAIGFEIGKYLDRTGHSPPGNHQPASGDPIAHGKTPQKAAETESKD